MARRRRRPATLALARVAASLLALKAAAGTSVPVHALSARDGIPAPQQALYSIPVSSPVVRFTPSNLGTPDLAWSLTFPASLNTNSSAGPLGLGQAACSTSLGNRSANIDIQFVGTGISIIGVGGPNDVVVWSCDTSSSAAATMGLTSTMFAQPTLAPASAVPSTPAPAANTMVMTMDGIPMTMASVGPNLGTTSLGELAFARNLLWGPHSCSLSVVSTSPQITVLEVLITTGMQGGLLVDGHSTAKTRVPTIDANGMASSNFMNADAWEVYTPTQQPVSAEWVAFQAPQPYKVLRSKNAVFLHYTVPLRTTFLEVYGSIGSGFGSYTLNFSPDPPFSPPTGSYTANSPYYAPWQLLGFGILHPNVGYMLMIEVKSNAWVEIYGVEYMTDYSATTNGTNSTTHTVINNTPKAASASAGIIRLKAGELAGVIIGTFVGAVAICVAIGWFLFARYKKQPPPASPFMVDNHTVHQSDPNLVPFHQNSRTTLDLGTTTNTGHTSLLGDTGTDTRGSMVSPTVATIDTRPQSNASALDTRQQLIDATSEATSSRDSTGQKSYQRSSSLLHVQNDTTGSGYGSDMIAPRPRRPLPVPEPPRVRSGSFAPPPLPIPIQEVDSGANVILEFGRAPVVERVPPAYDPSRPVGNNARNSQSTL